jgi:hypothetical protein
MFKIYLKYLIANKRRVLCIIGFLILLFTIINFYTIIAHIQLFFTPSKGVYAKYSFYDREKDQFHFSSFFRIEAKHADTIVGNLSHSAYLFRLESISLGKVDLTEQFFLSASKHTNLKYLYLYNCNFDSQWLQHIAKCKNILWIDVENDQHHNQRHSNIIKSLEKNYSLRELNLSGIDITDQDISTLYKLRSLELLAIRSCTIQTLQAEKELFEFIQNSSTLRFLALKDIHNSENYLQSIFDSQSLFSISMYNDNITDENLIKIIFNAGKLKRINIQSKSISDDGLQKICIPLDTELTLWNTSITQDGCDTFLRSNPHLTGYYKNGRMVIKNHKLQK